MNVPNKHIFKEYDIRGVVERDFPDDLVIAIGKAFGSYISAGTANPSPRIGIGRDVRLSSPHLFKLLAQGLLTTGAEVVSLGVCPTPVTYYSLFHLPLDGAVMITGSHNPKEFNGFKLCYNKTTIFGEDIQKIRTMIETDSFRQGTGKMSDYPILEAYQNYQMKRHAELKKGKRPLKIAVDPGNATGALVMPSLLSNLGCSVIEINCTIDGNFPNHHPDPTIPENLQTLVKAVRENHADFGMAFDGDADRLGIVSETGDILWGDEIMVILARDIVKRHPGATIIGEVKCSQRMYDALDRAGARGIMWKTGHSLIKNKMKEEKALLAGEMSGHIFFSENYFGFDDAIHAGLEMARIVSEHLDAGGKGLSELISDLPPAHNTPEIRVDCSDEGKFALVARLSEQIRQHHQSGKSPVIRRLITIDGVRAVFEHGWGLTRASNTQPILVSRFEADSPQHVQEYQRFFEEMLAKA
jgi:phosphomannomutase/phosphoglucomutase